MEKRCLFNCKIIDLSKRIEEWMYSEELQNIVHAFGGVYPVSVSPANLAKWLLDFSECWDYRKNQAQAKDRKTGENARWNINSTDITETQALAVERGISALGLIGVEMPCEKNFDYVIALGGARF